MDLKIFTDALVNNVVILFYNITSWDDVSPLTKILKTSVRILLVEREDVCVCVMTWIGGECCWRGPDQAMTDSWRENLTISEDKANYYDDPDLHLHTHTWLENLNITAQLIGFGPVGDRMGSKP